MRGKEKKTPNCARTNCPLLLGDAVAFLLDATDFPAIETLAATAVVMDTADMVRNNVQVRAK